MYFCRQPLPEIGVLTLRALRVSMNTPVVAIEEFAVGPARAAIALADAPGGGRALMLALRSRRTGQLACFAPDEALEDDGSAQIALDGALSFAESMGFLFEDDAVCGRGPEALREAAQAWNELLGLEPPAPAPEAADELEIDDGEAPELEVDPEPGASGDPAEIWLEQLAAPELPPPAPAPPVVLLTKFRRTASPGRRAGQGGWSIRLLSHF
jgi:hypothetical protein